MRNTHYEDQQLYMPRRVRFIDSATIKHGQVVHFHTAYTDTATDTETKLRNESNYRASRVTKCTLANIDAPAGIAVIGEGGTKTGPCELDILPIDALQREEVPVYTDVNAAVGDLLGSVPGSYTLGKSVCAKPYFKVREARDRSSTAGLVRGRLGKMSWDEAATKITRHYDHFRNPNVPGVVAGALASHSYHLSGTTAMAIAPLATAQETVIPVTTGVGELSLLGTTTTIAQLQQIGGQYLLSAGRELFCRMRVKIDNIADEDWFWGLGTPPTQSGGVLTTVAQVTSAGTAPAATDYAGFFFDATGGANSDKIIWTQRKASGTAVLETTAIAPVNDTYIELAFLLRNRLAGAAASAKQAISFINGTAINDFSTATQNAQFPDTVPLAWAMSGITGACCCTIDYLEINHHV